MELENYVEDCKVIKKKVEGIISAVYSEKSSETVEFSGMYNQIVARGSGKTYIYIRIEPEQLNISNVQIGDKRRGILTAIVNNIKKDNDIHIPVAITSVVTKEMRDFCEKSRVYR